MDGYASYANAGLRLGVSLLCIGFQWIAEFSMRFALARADVDSPSPTLDESRDQGWNRSRAMPDATIHTHGRVLENRGPVLYQVSLPNGKTILAHLSKPLADAQAMFRPDDLVLLEMTPYDFDQARILGLAE